MHGRGPPPAILLGGAWDSGAAASQFLVRPGARWITLTHSRSSLSRLHSPHMISVPGTSPRQRRGVLDGRSHRAAGDRIAAQGLPPRFLRWLAASSLAAVLVGSPARAQTLN